MINKKKKEKKKKKKKNKKKQKKKEMTKKQKGEEEKKKETTIIPTELLFPGIGAFTLRHYEDNLFRTPTPGSIIIDAFSTLIPTARAECIPNSYSQRVWASMLSKLLLPGVWG